MKHLLAAIIFIFGSVSCVEDDVGLRASECLTGELALIDKLSGGLKTAYLSYELRSVNYIEVNGATSDKSVLVKAYVEGIVSEGEDEAYGSAHWIVDIREGEFDYIQSIPGNASTYFEFDVVSTETEIWLYENGYWSSINSCD